MMDEEGRIPDSELPTLSSLRGLLKGCFERKSESDTTNPKEMVEVILRAIEEEREGCAKIADAVSMEEIDPEWERAADRIAERIRARGKTIDRVIADYLRQHREAKR